MNSFAQCLNDTEKQHRHILLGNGFSQAWNKETFNYKFLFEKADFGERNLAIKSIFQKFNTYDFETVMFNLLASADVLESYGGNKEFVEQIRNDAETLKNSLIQAITDCHPRLPNSVTNEQYEAVRHFLHEFQNIFTVNYDLLMYWARNKWEIPPEDFETDDGFRAQQTWRGYNIKTQQVFFLHGGLHIFDNGLEIKKHAYREDEESSIIEQVKNNLRDNKFPLFVSEPNYKQKEKRIKHNPYLDHGYRKLAELDGSMYIYGHSFDESDKHIFDQLKESDIETFYISIFGDENSPENQRTKANAITYLNGKAIQFFDASSAHIWAHPE